MKEIFSTHHFMDDKALGDPLIGHVGRINELTFSPDGGTLFSGGSDGTILVWDWEKISQIEDK